MTANPLALHAYLRFGLAAAILIVSPGPDVTLVLRTAASEGTRRATFTALGCCLGSLVWGIAVALGVGSLIAHNTTLYGVFRTVGAAYLCYLGLTILRHTVSAPAYPAASSGISPLGTRIGTKPASATGLAASGCSSLRRGLLTTTSNPKVGVFYVTFMPQFVPHGGSAPFYIVGFAALNSLEALAWFAVLLYATRQVAAWLSQPHIVRNGERLSGAILLGLGMRLALSRR